MVWVSCPFSLTGSSFSFSHLYGWAFAPGSVLNLVFSLPAVLWEHIKIKIVLICSHKLASHSPQLARNHHPGNSLPPTNMSKTEFIFPFQNWLSSWLFIFCQHYRYFPMLLCHLTIFIFNLPLCVCVCVCVCACMRARVCVLNCPVISNSLWPHGLQPTRVLWPWGFPGKNTEVGCHYLPQGTSWPGTESMSLASPALAGRYFTLHHLGSRELTSRVLENRSFVRFLDSIDLFPLPPISFSAGVQPRQDPGVPSRWRASAREDTWDQPW